MTIISYKEKNYDFSWTSIGLFLIFCPLIAFLLYLLFDLLWIFTHVPFIIPNIILLTILTGTSFTFHPSTSASMYLFTVQGTDIVGFVSDCAGIYVYVVYIAICVLTPHNKSNSENDRIWKRKGYTFMVSSVIFFLENTIRITLNVFLFYNGVPFNPLHDNLSYFSIFFAVFLFFIISYYWLPELVLFVLWILESIKVKLISIKSKINNNLDDISQVVEIKTSLVISIWTIILIAIALIFSIVLI